MRRDEGKDEEGLGGGLNEERYPQTGLDDCCAGRRVLYSFMKKTKYDYSFGDLSQLRS